MDLSLDKVMAGCVGELMPWDFTVTRNGITHHTRPVTVNAMFAEIPLVEYFVDGDAPKDLNTWTQDEVQAFMTGIEVYSVSRSKKNRGRLRSEVEKALTER